jgi:adenylate kinase
MRQEKDQQTKGEPAAGSQPLNVVLVGLPGSGKGTQGSQFARRHGIPKISTGDMLRDAVARGTALGREVEATLASGGLVPDDMIIRVVEARLQHPDTRGGFVLDGFPRTLPLAAALERLMTGRGRLIVIYLDVSPDVILHRILSRRICESCGQADTGAPTTEYCASCGGSFVTRADDHEDVVRRRVAAYVENTAPLVEWYRKAPTFRAIDGNQPLADVARAFDAAVLDSVNAAGNA